MNLSDIFEYMSSENSDALFSLLGARASTGGLIAFWNLFNDRLPPAFHSKFTILDISQKLHKIDQVFFYKAFWVIQVN